MKKGDKSEVANLYHKENELVIANAEKVKREAELAFANEEKAKREAELVIANKQKANREAELVIAKGEKEKRANELIIANIKKAERAEELIIANKELFFQNREKEKRADELIMANKELAFQNSEKEKRVAELVIANSEKEKRADELIMANIELAFQNEEKEKRVAELIIADKEKKKRAEELISTNKELKQLLQLNADKNLFISILAHDLRSPFNALLGLTEVLIEDIRKFNTDEIEEIADNINKSARNTFNLLENILSWARAEQGKIPFDPQILSFTDNCKDAVEVLKPIAKAKNIKIDYSTVDHINIYADIDMLKAVLRNLVSNAIKFTNNGGTISITAKQIDSNITISVSDNGIGIAPHNLMKLFEMSEVISTTGTAEETGTGLGLLLCKGFVEKHQGKIWVESEVGKGSDFKFTLPVLTEQAIDINN